MTRLLALMVAGAALVAGEAPERWAPHDHPAVVTQRLSGYTRPKRVLDLAAEVAARVVTVALDEGQAAGDEPAIVLDDALARLDEVRAGADLALAIAERDAAERERAFRADELERAATLAEREASSAAILDAARSAADQARHRAAAAEARRFQAEAALERAQEIVARHRLHAPAGWIVIRRLAEPGMLAASGATLLALADCATLAIELRLSEEEIAALRALPSVPVRFPGRDATASGRLARVDVAFDEHTRKRLVEIEVRGADAPEPSGGLPIAIELALADATGALLVPEAFVRAAYERASVRTEAGDELTVLPLRRADGMIAIAPTDLPAGVVLAPWPRAGAP
ncbi:MAG TPA: HlyD family efflux transporter periplasmic adaptor subunit [Planctomycetota bacterium]|nr:HlyD family efflux transporter periplasmic adaptor subunit [Planctomycetota bacterium]